MDAGLLLRKRVALLENAFVEMVVSRVPDPVGGSTHRLKYRLALIENNVCVLRYDNEAGKGGHEHVGKREGRYHFVNLNRLQADFWKDVSVWLEKRTER